MSDLHDNSEYGAEVDREGRHSGGPFVINVSPKMRIEQLRCIIRVSLQKGSRVEDVIPACPLRER